MHKFSRFSLLLLALLLGATAANGQQSQRKPKNLSKNFGAVATATRHAAGADTGFDAGQQPSVPPAERGFLESVAGRTVYDLQSNGATAPRIHNWGGGVVSAAWTISLTGSEAAGYADRGTGYNKTDATGTFGPQPTSRIEGATRTGFPSYFVTGSGEEWTISHLGTLGAWKIHYAHKPAGGTAWTQGDLPLTTPNGGLWARACAGGPDGNTIHVIYLTSPTASNIGGSLVDGMDGTLRYCRSTNGGATWDIIDAALPGLDGSNWRSITAEGYGIDAHGNTVAIGVYDSFHDLAIWKSSDNGTTWEDRRIVNDFPLNDWAIDDGYTFAEVGMQYDSTYYPDSLAIFTSDGTATVLVDDNGLVHVAYPSLFVLDPDTTKNGTYNYYPGYNLGIVYWNEGMTDNSGTFIANSPDINGDGTWGSPDNPSPTHYADGYGDGFCTGPTLGVGDDGRLYMTFITDNELYYDADGNWLRHPFIIRSEPNDPSNWPTTAVEIITPETVADFGIAVFWENYFAGVARHVDDKAHILFQQDFLPGLTLRVTGNQTADENFMTYIGFPISAMPVGTFSPAQTLDFSIAPNPASDRARVTFASEKSEELVIEIFNALGARVQSQALKTAAGPVSVDVNTAALSNGVYFVRVGNGKDFGTKKLIVSKQ